MLKIRWSHDCLILNTGIPIPGETMFILIRGPEGTLQLMALQIFLWIPIISYPLCWPGCNFVIEMLPFSICIPTIEIRQYHDHIIWKCQTLYLKKKQPSYWTEAPMTQLKMAFGMSHNHIVFFILKWKYCQNLEMVQYGFHHEHTLLWGVMYSELNKLSF